SAREAVRVDGAVVIRCRIMRDANRGSAVESAVSVIATHSIEEWRIVISPVRRIEAPSERVIEDAIAWNEGVARKPRVPVPSPADPAWAVEAVRVVGARGIDVGFGHIVGAQAAPAVEIGGLEVFLVEAGRLQITARVQRQLMPAFDRNVVIVLLNLGLAV